MLMGSISSSAAVDSTLCETPWHAWETFKKSTLSEEGRIVDSSMGDMRTTSEGQAYALFFALVANDRDTFDKLLGWTETHQTQDDLTARLPGWNWGTGENGAKEQLDGNSASDADLWMAYALGEAGRLWSDRRYVALSSLIADRILSSTTLEAPKLGLVLLPGAVGFTPTPNSVRLNASYVPLQLLQWFVAHSKDPRWAKLLYSSQQLIVKSAPKGYAADWMIYDFERGFLPDTESEKGAVGSYDAIRVYLWAGMMSRGSAERDTILSALKPMARLVENQGAPPKEIHIITGHANRPGPSGFSAAMLPFLLASGYDRAAQAQLALLDEQPIAEDSYYDQVLALFALGWRDELYQFDSKGNLIPRWTTKCK
ncbi:MAG: endo-1,4-D-glucanase [Gallionellaceae bacterium CG1_02_56_997]|nr:MAG: endo-1,4-D-glucanase [Gallionellaceae bacterium CG1_02_56_997]